VILKRKATRETSRKKKTLKIVRHPEHAAFLTGIDAALERLASIKQLSYSDLKTRYEQQKLKRKGGA
jgi:hypothetical protein